MKKKTVIEDGDTVVFRQEGSSRIFTIRRKRMVYFSKQKFSIDELIGQPYGSTYELDKGKLSKVEIKPEATTGDVSAPSSDQPADNRNLLDREKNQKMSKEDIMKMREEGATGEKIIEELIENSETFQTKTEFSKAKYLKKKKKKHLLVFTVYQPTPRLVLEMYGREPGKINFLRADSLSQLLCFSNAMSGSHVAVMESSQGLLVASLLHRMGGEGKLIQLIPSSQNPATRTIFDYFSFPKEQQDNVYTFPLDRLSLLGKEGTEEKSGAKDPSDNSQEPSDSAVSAKSTDSRQVPGTDSEQMEDSVTEDQEGSEPKKIRLEEKTVDASTGEMETEVKKTTSEAGTSEGASSKLSEETGEMECVGGKDASSDATKNGQTDAQNPPEGEKPFVKNRELQRIAREKRFTEAGEILKQKQIDSLVIACKQNPVPVLKKMLEFLGPSRTVVVFCQYIDPLIECYTYVKERHLGIQLRLSDSWLREYQVLPQRTHPKVNMSGTGGYLLTFVSTLPSPK